MTVISKSIAFELNDILTLGTLTKYAHKLAWLVFPADPNPVDGDSRQTDEQTDPSVRGGRVDRNHEQKQIDQQKQNRKGQVNLNRGREHKLNII